MNKQQKEVAKINRLFAKAKNGKVAKVTRSTKDKKWNVEIEAKEHGSHSFLEPAEALASARQRGISNRFTKKNRPA